MEDEVPGMEGNSHRVTVKQYGHELTERLRRWMVWLYRWHHSRGFGIQSPADYRFVRYVVNEHWPYYAYSELKSWKKDVGKRWHRFGLFLFRLSNFWHPQLVFLCGGGMEVFRPYLYAGYRHTCVTVGVVDVSNLCDCCRRTVWVVSADECNRTLLKQIIGLAISEWVLVVVGIYRKRESEKLWENLKTAPRVRITFDLYDAGVIFFDKSRAKQNYKVNF